MPAVRPGSHDPTRALCFFLSHLHNSLTFPLQQHKSNIVRDFAVQWGWRIKANNARNFAINAKVRKRWAIELQENDIIAEISQSRHLIMAKTGVLETDPRVAELKKELQRLVKSIVEDDDYSVEVMDRAREALCSIKDLKVKRSMSLKLHGPHSFPEEFRCPLSREMMRDPVILATGQVRVWIGMIALFGLWENTGKWGNFNFVVVWGGGKLWFLAGWA